MAYLCALVNPLIELKYALEISDASRIYDMLRISEVRGTLAIHDMSRISDIYGPLGSYIIIHLSGSLYCLRDHLSL